MMRTSRAIGLPLQSFKAGTLPWHCVSVVVLVSDFLFDLLSSFTWVLVYGS